MKKASPTSILICSGTSFDFLHPEESVLTIQDVAHSLSNLCRFAGHCRTFYSVAQHSVLVSHQVPWEDQYIALMHDAAEAFVGDIPKPLKNLLPDYQQLEQQIEAIVFAKFGIALPLPSSVKNADLRLLATERRDLMPDCRDEWESIRGVQPLPFIIEPLGPTEARALFLRRYASLSARRVTDLTLRF